MNTKALISVIVPLYNKEPWVKRCILSIINQTYQELEILIINDGSTDDSRNVVAAINDPRIKIFDKLNGGLSTARNYGIEKAKGEYIALIDADDEWKIRHLEVMIKGFYQFENAVLICDDYIEVTPNYKREVARRNLPFVVSVEKIQYHSIEDYLKTLSDGYFLLSGCSILIKVEIIKKHNLQFLSESEPSEDINYWIRLNQLGEFIFCDYVGLFYHRVDNESIMNKKMTNVKLTPPFFYGNNIKKYNKKDQSNIKKFLSREYYKKAYQNRGLAFRKEEFSSCIGGGVQIGRMNVLVYLAIRYCPQFIFSLYKSYKKEKVNDEIVK